MAGNRVRSPKTEVPKLGCAFRCFHWQLPLVRQRGRKIVSNFASLATLSSIAVRTCL